MSRMAEAPIDRPVPEMSRMFATARVGAGISTIVQARPEECRALAARLGLEAIHTLVCCFDLKCSADHTIAAAGQLKAKVRQICVISLEPFDSDVVDNFAILFVPAGSQSAEFDLEADDEVPYEGSALDLGEAVSEQLALALETFPRKPGAEVEHGFLL